MKKNIIFLLFFLFTIPATAGEYIVDRIINNTTIQLKGGEVVVLAGIQPAPTEDGQSISYIENMLYSRKVWLEYDIVRKNESGFTLAYVYTPICTWDDIDPPCRTTPSDYYHAVKIEAALKAHGLYNFINGSLIKSGYSIVDEESPNSEHERVFNELLTYAKKKKRGVWAYYREPPAHCLQDFKLCPDGSFVVREGKKCKFAACP